MVDFFRNIQPSSANPGIQSSSPYFSHKSFKQRFSGFRRRRRDRELPRFRCVAKSLAPKGSEIMARRRRRCARWAESQMSLCSLQGEPRAGASNPSNIARCTRSPRKWQRTGPPTTSTGNDESGLFFPKVRGWKIEKTRCCGPTIGQFCSLSGQPQILQ